MKALLTSLIALSWLAISIFPEPAQAARVGGGRSVGVQRSVTPPPRAAQPAQNQAASAAAPAAAPAAAAGGNRWLAPLAGLAAGLGLGWLISQGGFGALGSALLVALLAGVAVFVLLRVFARSRPQMQSAAYGGTARVANPDPVGSPIGAQWAGAGGAGVAAAAPNVPAGFNIEAFVRQARLNFLRLQEANDRGDVQTLREVATDDMASALAADVASRAGRSQRTEVEGLAATLLEVTTEGDAHWASVSFQGTARDGDDAPAPFHEIWHLRKPVDGRSGWLLAGIQQTS